MVERALTEHPGATADPTDDVLVSAWLELARLQIATGRIKDARRTARTIVDGYHAAGMDSHPLCLDALGQLAEAELTVDVSETRAREEYWRQAARDARDAYARYERTLGRSNPRTLFAAYQRDLSLVRSGRPKAALAALADTERRVVQVLGAGHPLRCRVRYAMAQAHGQRHEYRRVRALLAELHDQLLALLGPYHPDTLASELDLGIAMAMLGESDPARAHVDRATKRISAELGWRAELRSRAEVTRMLMRLPPFIWPTFDVVSRWFGSPENEDDVDSAE
jgi:hypothetical protein